MDRSARRYRHDQRVHIATGPHLHTVAVNGEIRHPMQRRSELFMRLLHIFSDFPWSSPSSESPVICFTVFRKTGAEQPPIPCVDRSEEQTSELQSLMRISYAVFCLEKKKHNYTNTANRSDHH